VVAVPFCIPRPLTAAIPKAASMEIATIEPASRNFLGADGLDTRFLL
jgi:hypothetical protein